MNKIAIIGAVQFGTAISNSIALNKENEVIFFSKNLNKVEESWEQKIKDVEVNDVDLFIMGDDWLGKFDYLSTNFKVKYLPKTPGTLTSELKKLVQ